MRLTLAFALSVAVAGCGQAMPSPTPGSSPIPALAHYDDGRYVSFDYPVEWLSDSFPISSTNFETFVWLSTEPGWRQVVWVDCRPRP